MNLITYIRTHFHCTAGHIASVLWQSYASGDHQICHRQQLQTVSYFSFLNNNAYHFEEVRGIIDLHKSRAFRVVNNESILCNWEVGRYVSDKLKTSQWGNKVIDQLANYLMQNQPDLRGYNRHSLYRMVQFYDTYSTSEFVSTLLTQIQQPDNKASIIVSTTWTQFKDESFIISFLTTINWSSHLEIMSNCKTYEERIYYISLCQKEHLNFKELQRQLISKEILQKHLSEYYNHAMGTLLDDDN